MGKKIESRDHGLNICPRCGSGDIMNCNHSFNEEFLIERVQCVECGSRFSQLYKFSYQVWEVDDGEE